MSKPTANDHLELWLSWLLRGGTSLALILIAVAFILNLTSGQSWMGPTDLTLLLAGSNVIRSDPPANLAEFVYGFTSGESLKFVQAAVLILILLPAFRVAFLLGNFARRRDVAFVVFSMVVLSVLLAAFWFGIET